MGVGASIARAACVAAVLLAACNSPRLRKFFGAGAPFVRTFGQLYLDGATRKVSHYAVLDLSIAPDLRALATGTIEYKQAFDGMGNCLLLRPKKYFSTPNRFDGLRRLPKPGAVVFAYCNLDEAQVKTAVEAIYTDRLSAAEAPAAATHFIAHDEGFTRLDVVADEADLTQSTLLGRAIGGQLYVAALTERDDGTRRYVNPMPYLAGAIQPATDLDAVTPAIAGVVFETSASGNFTDAVAYTIGGDVVTGPVSRDHLRVAIQPTETTRPGALAVVPYSISYELSAVTLSGATVATRNPIVRGTALLNTVDFADVTTLAGKMYAAASDPATGMYNIYLPWIGIPAPEPDAAAFDALDPTAPFVLDLTATAPDSSPVFASGEYELRLSIADAVNPPAERSIRFTLGGSALPPGDGEVSYTPSNGPVGTTLVVTTVVPGAFAAGSTTVTFDGTFTPAGTGYAGEALGTTAPFTIAYAAPDVTVIDGTHLSVRIGAVTPPLAILTSAPMRVGHGGRFAGSLRVQSGGGYDHTLATFAFTVTQAGRFGQLQGTSFVELETLPLMHAASATEVAEAPDFQRIVVELRIPDAVSPPATVDVKVHGLDASGATIDTRTHTLGFVGMEGQSAVFRGGEGGTRKLVLVDAAAHAGEQGTDVLAVHVAPGGGAFLSGEPP
jgi:hypothetical protein